MSAIGFAPVDMVFLGLTAFLVGMRRGGIQGAAVIGVTLLASHFSAAASVGITVVIFLYADIQATVILFREVDWRFLGRLLIPTLIGITVGAIIGRSLPTQVFGWVLFVLIFIAYGSMILQRRASVGRVAQGHPVITLLSGFLSGFTTMVGNLASIFVAVYFAAVGAKKEQFIATSVWFFFIVNLIKLPIHIWIWRTLTVEMVVRTLVLIPVVTAGIFLGRVLARRLSEDSYWNFVIVMAGVGVARYFAGLVGWF